MILICLLSLAILLVSALADLERANSSWPHSRKRQSTFDVNDAGMELFAVVGSGGCAERLWYGPQAVSTAGSADRFFRTFLSTNMPYKDIASKDWLEIVTVDGVTELFRIYWSFSTSKTYLQRIVDAVSVGEPVSYVIVDAERGYEFRYSGIWRFSSGAGITINTFNSAQSRCCLSRNGGLWGGGSGTIDGNNFRRRGGYNAHFWGLGNYNNADSTDCHVVFAEERGYVFSSAPIAYMYHSTLDAPTQAPTVRATASPTFTAAPTFPAPTAVPTTMRPTAAPSPSFQPTIQGQQLFAIIGGDSCAKTLHYGTQSVTRSGSADGQHTSFLSTGTTYASIPHTEWLQIVTSDGTKEMYRIYWTFDTARKLEGHFTVGSSETGAVVSYRIVQYDGGEDVTGSFTWHFTSNAFDANAIFSTQESATCCFSETALWGVGDTQVSGKQVPLWGQVNAGGTDSRTCGDVYANGEQDSEVRSTGKSYFYYAVDATAVDGGSSGVKYALVQFRVRLVLRGISLSDYQLASDTYDDLFRKAIAWSLPGVAERDVTEITVSSSADAAVIAANVVENESHASSTDEGGDDDVSNADAPAPDQYALDLPLASQDTVLLQCIIRVENSAYSYGELSYALQVAVAGGAFDTQLHNYAAYLKLNAATTANGVAVSTEQIIDTSNNNQHSTSNSSSITTMTVVLVVVFVMAIATAFCWYERYAIFKTAGRVDIGIGSTHSLDEEAQTEITPRNGGGVALNSPPRTVSRPSAPTASSRSGRNLRSIQESRAMDSDHDEDGDEGGDDDAFEIGASRRVAAATAVPITALPAVHALPELAAQVPYTIVRASRTQPRGAVSVPFNTTGGATGQGRRSGHEEIVQITPRSVQIARSTPRRPSLTPVARAHLVQQGEETAGGAIAVTAVAAEPLTGSDSVALPVVARRGR